MIYYDFLITGEWNNTVWGPPHTTMNTLWGPPHTTMYWRPHQELLLLEAFAEVAGGGGLEGGAVHPPGVAVGGAGVEGPQVGVRRVRALRHLQPRLLRQLLQLLQCSLQFYLKNTANTVSHGNLSIYQNNNKKIRKTNFSPK